MKRLENFGPLNTTLMMDDNTPSVASSGSFKFLHNSKTKKSFDSLPNELLEFVLKRLTMQNLIPLRLVCRLWALVIPKMRCFLHKKSLKLFGSYDCAESYEKAMVNGLYHFLDNVKQLKLKPPGMDDHLVVDFDYFNAARHNRCLVLLFPAVQDLVLCADLDVNLVRLLNSPVWQNQMKSLCLFVQLPVENVAPGLMARLFETINSLSSLKRFTFFPYRQSNSIRLPSLDLLSPTLARLHSFTVRLHPKLDSWTRLENVSTIRYLGPHCTRLCIDYVDGEAMPNSLFDDFSFINVNFVRNLTFLRLSKIEDPSSLWQLAPHFPSLEVIHIGFDEITFCDWMFAVVRNAEEEIGDDSGGSGGPDPDDVFRVAMFPRFSAPIREVHFDFYRTVFMYRAVSHTLLHTFVRTLSVMFPRVQKLVISVHETAPSPSEAKWFAIQVSKFIDKVFGKFEQHEVAVVYSNGRVVLDQSVIDASRGWYEEQ